MKNCSLWKGSCWRSSCKTVSLGRDSCNGSREDCDQSSPFGVKVAKTCDELTTRPVPSPPALQSEGDRECGSEAEPGKMERMGV